MKGLVFVLSLWLFAAPWTFGADNFAMSVSSYMCAALLLIAGSLLLWSRSKYPYLLVALTGVWLQLAPLVFWASTPFSYLNSTLVGLLAIAFAFFTPFGVPNEAGENPPGWKSNPSDWGGRYVTIFLAMVCWILARYLASYQLGYIHEVEDPLFGDGTLKVITSPIAKLFPVSDAGLGAFGYSLEFLLGWMGGVRRWRTMPWLVVLFGVMVVPAGIISILLILSQPLFVGAWCGICLGIAACMLVMIYLATPEFIAVCQLLRKCKGKFWSTFWNGLE